MTRILVVLTVLAAASPALAWSPITGSRPTWCGTAPYHLNSAGSADLGFSTSESEVRRGMDDWSRVSCSGLVTNYAGTTSAQPGRYEGTPTVGWIESGWREDPNAIGVTGPQWNGRGCIIEADMQLNGVNYSWTTGSGRGSSVNAYSIILHEGGHYYGLGHSSDRNATMYFAYSGGVSSLNGDDEAGICALYPGGGTPTDCTVTGCPAGQECVGGSCQNITGDGSICSPCRGNDECGGRGDFCLGYPDGGGYCGTSCRVNGDCNAGDICAPLSGGARNCVRVDGTRPDCSTAPMTGCTNDSQCGASEVCDRDTGNCVAAPTDRGSLGDPCATGDECNSGVCFAGACSRSCDWLDPTSCPAGHYCSGSATGSCGDGLCLPGTPGAGAVGAACEDNTECAGLFCADGICTEPCLPGVGDMCPATEVCRMGALPGCGSCQPASELGEDCDVNEDCTSRRCAEEGDRTFCTDFCDEMTPCPDGFTCEAAGDAMVCVPPAGGRGGARGGCCSVAPGADDGGPLAPWLLLLLPVAWMARRRRR